MDGNGFPSKFENIIALSDITWQKINERYYWRGGKDYVAKKVGECVACSYKLNTHWKAPVPPLKAIPVTPKLFWRIGVDLLGPLSQTINGNSYIALGVCAFSKYVEAQGNFGTHK